MDGFDLGAGAVRARARARRRRAPRAAGDVQAVTGKATRLWLVLGGGAVFAAWPLLYAASFSGFYFAILLILLALIVRPVALSVRNKIGGSALASNLGRHADLQRHRAVASVRRRASATLFLGVPLRFDVTLRMTYEGGLIGLLRPFALLCGLVSLSMLLMHGATYLALKGRQRHRAARPCAR